MIDRSRYYASLEAEVPKSVQRRRRRTKADLVKLDLPAEEDNDEAPHDSDVTHRRMNELRCNELLYLLKKHHGGADGA